MKSRSIKAMLRLVSSLIAVTLVCAIRAEAQVPPPGDSAVFAQPSAEVIAAIADVLGQRPDAPGASGDITQSLSSAVRDEGSATISTAALPATNADMSGMVADADQQYVSAAGGRYVVTVVVDDLGDGRTRVRVIPLIIAEVPEADSPIGGRPVRSNGTLEGTVLSAITDRLGS